MAVAAILPAACPAGAASAQHTVGEPPRSYEVLLPDGPTAGSALVVFLHGTSDPKLDRFRAEYAPLFLRRRCVVALPRASDRLKWRYADAAYIQDVIADVRRRYGTDPAKVLLMGVSGGGQTALFLLDHAPKAFRAAILVSTNPVVIRERHYRWFYPPAETLKTCPYFVVNHITQGAALQYWRQVRARKEPAGASISILPVLGPVGHYQPPPKPLGAWLDAVLAGRHPAPLPDPQKAAVAKMFAPALAALPAALDAAAPAADGPTFRKDGELLTLSFRAPPGYVRSARKEDKADADDKPITQLRAEHEKWPLYIRCEARRRAERMHDVLAAEQRQTALRGLLYQVYRKQALAVGGRTWQLRVGSITYPDRTRGWVSTLFLHAAAPLDATGRQWLEVTVLDETHQPDPRQLAVALRTALQTISAAPRP